MHQSLPKLNSACESAGSEHTQTSEINWQRKLRNLTTDIDEEAKTYQCHVASYAASYSSDASDASTSPRPQKCLLDTSDSSRLPCWRAGAGH